MKRFLVVLMVLGMAASAQAAIELSINGQTDGPGNVTEITMKVCDTIMIDITSNDNAQYSAYLDMDPQSSPGGDPLTDGGEWIPPMNIYPAAGQNASVQPVSDYQAWLVVAADFVSHPVPGTHFAIVYHCKGLDVLGEGVALTLYSAADWGGTPLDQIIIHQIPEPMTMCLLGLGGLFLRRRK